MAGSTTERAIAHCTHCPKLCRPACPVSEAERSEAATPWAKMLTWGLVREGRLPLSAMQELAYRCTSCKLQQQFCKHRNDVAPIMEEVRADLFRQDAQPQPARSFAARFREHDNPFGPELLAVRNALRTGSEPIRPVTGVGVYFPDCAELRHEPTGARHTLELMEELTERPMHLPPDKTPPCCGYPLYAIGDQSGFEQHARRVRDTLGDSDRIICSGPACAWTFQTLYPRFGAPLARDPKVVPLDRFLWDERQSWLPGLEQDGPGDRTTLYHDPCYLGRYLGEYDAPRQVIEAVTGEPPAEMPWNRENSMCSGGGGCYRKVFPKGAGEMARRRLRTLTDGPADELATGCASCRRQFRRELNEPGQIVSLVDLIRRRIAEVEG